jgi:DNA-binding SARP family transcriptional activator
VTEFRILGPLEVVVDERPLELGGLKQRALLAMVLLEANKVVSSARLIDALWEEAAPETARKALQVYVSHLRKLLGRDRLETRPSGYLLRVGEDELDLDRFQGLRAEGKLVEALSLWRGPPLAELADLRFAQAEIARLEELHLACVEDRIDADLAASGHAELVGELEALVREHPLRQRLRGQLMLALYRSGREAEALEVYRATRGALVEALGIEPRRELRELEQAILRQDPTLDVVVEEAPAKSGRGPFVGREAELEQLRAGLDHAISGRGRLFLLVGEPGIGKSRLAEELIEQARSRRVDVVVGRCWEASGAPAYWPWVQALRGHADQAPPELAALLRGEPTASESESARFRLFDATAQFLRLRARPLLLFLDDMHAADEPSLLLLQFVARELGDARLLIVAACRDVDPIPGRELSAMLAEVARESVATRISLRGLGEPAVAEYVEAAAAELASPELIGALYEETEGNPLFLGETVRLLAVEGRIAIPPSVRDVISRRLSHLSEECNGVLALASVLGREFSLEALARMSDLGEADLLATLDEATGARVLSDGLRFAHILIRDVVYQRLSTPRRVRLHRLAIETLEGLYQVDSGPHLAELAHHAIAGSDFERALSYARSAGDQALALLAYEEAARLYAMALEALELCRFEDYETRCDLLLSLGEAQIRAGMTPTAKATFLDAAALARHNGLARALGRAAAGYAGRIVFSRAGADDRVVLLLEEAIAGLREDDAELRSRLLARLAGALRDEHSRARRDSLSREALDLARGSGPAALAYALAGRAHAITAPDTVDEMRALADELCRVAARAGDLEQLISGHILRVMLWLWFGDLDAARVDLAEAARIAQKLGQPAQLWLVLGQQANIAIGTGDFTAADTLVAEALAAGKLAQPDTAIPHELMQRAALAEFRGDPDTLEPDLRALAAQHPTRPVFRCAHVHLLARTGRLAEARRELADLARDRFAALPFDQEWLCATSFLAETTTLTGDTEVAATLYALLAPWGSFIAVDPSESFRGSLQRDLGLLAGVLERWDDAATHFEAALAANQRMGLRPWLARTQENYARILRLRAAPGDTEQAEELITAAHTAYRTLGMAASNHQALTPT